MNFSIFTHIGVLLTNKESSDILEKYLEKEVMVQLKSDFAKDMSLSSITKYFGESITNSKLNLIDQELKKL